jgi:hypothetical protein
LRLVLMGPPGAGILFSTSRNSIANGFSRKGDTIA